MISFGTTAEADHSLRDLCFIAGHRAVVTLARTVPIPSHNDTHRRIARLAAAIPSHPMGLSNRAAPSLLETRNQLIEHSLIEKEPQKRISR
ncbi:hypothetical protein QFZ94_008584 [Paraburkholderia sp. JPY465]|uniref:hypothetical protein n=1 Tax=Paraburkholderia sp. JPY465 TaxID=3042285 RepID=UPI003D1F92EF